MTLLLDTNVLLDVLDPRPQILSRRQRQVVEQLDPVEAFVSVISLWEISIKCRLGKLDCPVSPADLPVVIRDVGFRLLEVTAEDAVTPAHPAPDTRDPFDQMLIAQCQNYDLRLLTIDKILHRHPRSAKLW
jgi:PIN domain nuclease of toxin-antitoxin system